MTVRVFYDTEFHENGVKRPIEFISIGMVRDDGEEYYAISTAVMWHAVYQHEWLRNNVLTQLPGKVKSYGNGGGTFEPDLSTGLFKPRAQIAQEVADFCYVAYGQKRDDTRLYADFGGYDHVVLAQLFGTMMDLPDHMPMFTRDFQQINAMLRPGYTPPPQASDEHHALADARWLRDQFEALERALVGSQVGRLIDL